MKALILYSKKTKTLPKQGIIFYADVVGKSYIAIRHECVIVADLLEALDMAKPRKGEVVLNTIKA
jgi:hypothetical protein